MAYERKNLAGRYLAGRICPVCKKEFYPTPDHVYKYGGRIVCTWHCLCEAKKKGWL